MAKQRYGINDAYRGTVGTVIGYEWRGRWCLRSRPLRVHNPRTAKQQANRSLFKQMVELAGSMKVALRKGLRKRSMEQHMTECNQFVKYNKERFALDGEGKIMVEWESLIISEGEVAAPVFTLQDSGDRGSGSLETHAPVRYASTPSNLEGEPVSSDCDSCSPPMLGKRESSGFPGRGCARLPRRGEGVCSGEGITVEIPFLPHAEGERASGDDGVYLYAYCPEAGEGVLSAPAYRKTGSVQLTLPERWQGKEVHLYGFAVDYRGEASATTYIGCLESATCSHAPVRCAATPSSGHTPSPLRGSLAHPLPGNPLDSLFPNIGGEQLPQTELSGSSSLPGSAGDMACDRSGAKLGEGRGMPVAFRAEDERWCRRFAVVEECVQVGGSVS